MSRDKDYGIVVIGRNEGERLRRCLQSIRTDADGATIVYVDSGSTDRSVMIAEELGILVIKLRPPFSAARARNEGFATLKELQPEVRFVQFIDGDCELVTGWLTMALTFMEQRSDVAVVCGRRRELYPYASVYNFLCDLEWDTPVGIAAACGGDSLIRAQAFATVAGFRGELIAGEEPELCLRLREEAWKIWRLNVEMTRHDAAMTRFGQWWLRNVRFGYGITELSRLHWHSPLASWKRQLVRPILWAGVVPLLIVLGTFLDPAAITAVLLYPLLIVRIALRRGLANRGSWIYGLFITLGKFAELQGIATFLWRQRERRHVELIEYR